MGRKPYSALDQVARRRGWSCFGRRLGAGKPVVRADPFACQVFARSPGPLWRKCAGRLEGCCPRVAGIELTADRRCGIKRCHRRDRTEKLLVVDADCASPKPNTSHPVLRRRPTNRGRDHFRARSAWLCAASALGVNQRYDLVLDSMVACSRLSARQASSQRGHSVQCASVQSNTHKTKIRSYAGEVDLFIVDRPDNQRVYVIPGR